MTDHHLPSGPLRSLAAALQAAAEELRASGSPSARLDAELLLRHVLDLDRTALFLRMGEFLSPSSVAAFEALVRERATGVPVAYLTGGREFMGLRFAVGPGVLVPRPETEMLVEWAIAWASERDRSPVIVDVGTGPGTIALSLATFLDPATPAIIAVELSDEALTYADMNRTRMGLQGRVTLIQGDLLAPVSDRVELILANLPYLRADQIDENRDLVWEPRLALDGGEVGLAAIERLLHDAPRVLAPDGAIGLEIDPSQAEAVRRLAANALPDARVESMRDLAGDERFVLIQRSDTRLEKPQ